MKKLLLFTFSVFISAAGFAQTCTPDAQFAGSPAGLYPLGPLGPTCELIAPKTIVSLTDTVVTVTNPFPITATLFITQMRINAVSGLPAGLQLSTDVIGTADQDGPWGYWDNTGTVPNQTAAFGCAYVFGSGGDWDAAVGGGPNNDGEYPLVFEVDAYVESSDPAGVGAFIGLPTWVSLIDPGLGGGTFVIFDTLVVPTDYADIATAISGDSNVEPGTAYTYTVPQDPNVTYDWTVTNGAIQSGQGTNEISVIWSGSGNVEIDLTDDGCSGEDNLAVTAITTGLDEVAGINASIYPNPSNGEFNLRVERTDVLLVRVMDVSGKVIMNKQFAGSNLYNLDLQNSPSGVYILELESESGRTFKRLIKN